MLQYNLRCNEWFMFTCTITAAFSGESPFRHKNGTLAPPSRTAWDGQLEPIPNHILSSNFLPRGDNTIGLWLKSLSSWCWTVCADASCIRRSAHRAPAGLNWTGLDRTWQEPSSVSQWAFSAMHLDVTWVWSGLNGHDPLSQHREVGFPVGWNIHGRCHHRQHGDGRV